MYDLLKGIRVLDVSFASPAKVGAFLGELGADVIKVEPLAGDRIRIHPDKNLNALWNRGKRSVALDIRSPEGAALFLDLVKQADVMIDGLRYGSMKGWGLDYEEVARVKPGIVYLSINGMGRRGPYTSLGTHGWGYDAYAGLIPVERAGDGTPRMGKWASIGPHAGPLFATLGVTAALVKAIKTGQGQLIDVAQIDASALWQMEELMSRLNGGTGAREQQREGVRYQIYECKDGRLIQLQAYEWKFFERFATAVGQLDLIDISVQTDRRPGAMDSEIGNEELRRRLTAIILTKTAQEWIDFFLEHDIPGVPVYEDPANLAEDAHFTSRANVRLSHRGGGEAFYEPTTPIKLPGTKFEVRPAPELGEHTEEVLTEVLHLSEARIRQLREAKVIA